MEGKGALRLAVLVGAMLLTLPSLVGAQTGTMEARPSILDAVVDTVLAGAIGTYGRTPVMRTVVLRHASLARPVTVSAGVVEESWHDSSWLTAQLAKPSVLGACLEEGVFGCKLGPTTSVLAISLPQFPEPGKAMVQVYVTRPTGGGPGMRGLYAAQFLFTLSRVSGTWVISEVRNIGTT